MALLTCHECGNQVSDTATSCPQCGAKFGKVKGKKPGAGKIILTAFGLFVLVGIIRGLTGNYDSQSAPSPAETTNPAEPQRDLAAEKKRLDECSRQMKRIDGMVSNIEATGSMPKVYVTPKFINRTTIQDKSAFFELTQCIAMQGQDMKVPMRIMDARNGKQIGKWDGRQVKMN